jgi:transposase
MPPICPPLARFKLRHTQSQPILHHFHAWLTEYQAKILPKSPIGQAIAYTLKHWPGLTHYLTDGRLHIDNNATERDIKPFVIARKNFLFACTMAGTDALGVHFSLILTARHHGLNPFAYYETILKKIPLCKTMADFQQLLPWAITL